MTAGVFAGLPSPFHATRYHSLVVPEASLPRDMLVNARVAVTDGSTPHVMGFRHASAADPRRAVPPGKHRDRSMATGCSPTS